MGIVEYSKEYIVEFMPKSKKIKTATDTFNNENDFFNRSGKSLVNSELDKEFKFTFNICVSDDKVIGFKGGRTSEEDLFRDWQGETVFCNLSYCKEVSLWVKKCYEESKKQRTKVVMLLPIMDNNPYFRDIVYNKAIQIRFIKDYFKVGSPDISNDFQSVIVVF